MAMSGCLGMALQPKSLSEQERAFARKTIANYKDIRDLVMYGDLYRIVSSNDGHGYYSLMYVGKDKKRTVLYGYCVEYQSLTITPRFKLNGLDPNKKYLLKELNVDKSGFWGDGKIFTGSYLINEGINLKLQKCFDSVVFSLSEVEQ